MVLRLLDSKQPCTFLQPRAAPALAGCPEPTINSWGEVGALHVSGVLLESVTSGMPLPPISTLPHGLFHAFFLLFPSTVGTPVPLLSPPTPYVLTNCPSLLVMIFFWGLQCFSSSWDLVLLWTADHLLQVLAQAEDVKSGKHRRNSSFTENLGTQELQLNTLFLKKLSLPLLFSMLIRLCGLFTALRLYQKWEGWGEVPLLTPVLPEQLSHTRGFSYWVSAATFQACISSL